MVRTEYIIEFRSGTYFQSLEADHGGPKETARRFTTEAEADHLMRDHEWILFNGGMVVPVQVTY